MFSTKKVARSSSLPASKRPFTGKAGMSGRFGNSSAKKPASRWPAVRGKMQNGSLRKNGSTIPVAPPLPPNKGMFGRFGNSSANKPASRWPAVRGKMQNGSLRKNGSTIPVAPPLPPNKGMFGRTKLFGTKPTSRRTNIFDELQARTEGTRNRLNMQALRSEGGTGISGVQRTQTNQTMTQAAGAKNSMITELKQRFASRGNKPMLEALGRLAPGLVPVPYRRGIRNFDRTKQILVNATGRPFIVFIPAQMRDQNKEILSDSSLRPSLLDMRFVRKSESPSMAVFGDGYYNMRLFGNSPVPPVPVVVNTVRCNELRDQIARLTSELEQYGC